MKCASCIPARLHRLSLTVIFCFLGIFSVIGCQISCKSNVQVNLDQNGEALLTPFLFLTNAVDCTGPYVVTTTANASVITDNILRCAQVGQNIIAQVTDSETQTSCWSTVSVSDYNPPKFVNCLDVYVQCNVSESIDDISNVTVQDNCDPNPTVSFIDDETIFSCDTYSKVITRTWNAVDSDGHQSNPCIQNIYFEAVTLSEISLPANYTFNTCGDPNTSPEVTGFPNENGNSISGGHCGLLIQFTDETYPSCGNAIKILRNWTVYDWCGNPPLTGIQTIELIDDTPPIIVCPTDTILFNSNSQHNCTGDASALSLSVTDDCGNATIEYNWEYANNATNVPVGIHPVIAIATDECNNQSTCEFYIEIKDTNAPIAICDSDLVVSLSNNGNAVITAINFDSGSFDNCIIVDTLIAIDGNFGDQVEVTCSDIGDTLEITLMVVDACGNSTMCSSNVTIEDNTPPTLTCPADVTVLCSDDTADLSVTGLATAIDNCNTYTATYTDNANLTTCNTGSIIRTWQVAEANNVVTCNQVITLLGETPTIVFPEDVTVSCGASGGEPIVEYNCPGLFVGSNDEVNSDLGCTKITTKTWKVYNSCTDELWEQEQKVTEIDDVDPIIVTPAQNSAVDCNNTDPMTALNAWLGNNGNAVASDNCTDLVWSNNYATLTAGCPGTSSTDVTFTVIDECGNSASTLATFSVADNTPPQFIIPPPDTTFSCNVKDLTTLNAYFNSGAASTFTDNCSDVSVSFTLENPNSIFCGTFPTTIILTDECGNVNSSTFQLTIIDEQAPVINVEAKDLNLSCDADIDMEINAWLAINASATAFDRCSDIQWTNDYNPEAQLCGSTEGLAVNFSATDACGNSTITTASIFIVDTEAPQFINPPQDITLNCTEDLDNEIFAFVQDGNGATFSDNCGTPTLFGRITGAPVTGCGTMNVNFTLVDNCDNATQVVAQITIEDTTAPVITQAPQNQLVQCVDDDIQGTLQVWLDANGNATATDGCGDLTWTNNYAGLLPSCDGTSQAEVTFTATDLCGNTTDVIGVFSVQDITPPVISFNASDVTVECDGDGNVDELQNWLQTQGGAFASDECGQVEWVNDFSQLQEACGATGSTIVTFSAIDPCGNTSTTSGSFTIIDTTPPIFVAPPMDYFTECDGMGNTAEFELWSTNIGGGFPRDECSSVSITFDLSSTVLNCTDGESKTITVLYVAVDDCGNSNTALADFIINDTTAPTINCPDDIEEIDLNSNCNNDVVIDDAIGSDFCSDDLVYSFDIDYYQDATFDVSQDGQNATGNFPVGVHYVYYTVEDECGNSGTCRQIVDVIDIVSPQIECNDFVIYLDENGEYLLDTDIIGNATDNCGDIQAMANLDRVDCDNIPIVTLTLSATDPYGNPSSCTKVYAVVDTFNVCTGPQSEMGLIAGNLYKEDFEELENASIILSDGMSSTHTTNSYGEYNFNVNTGLNYTITPFKNDDPQNGVSTIDLITLQLHILGSIPLDSPYQLIAADANNSGSISTLDLVEIQRLILGIIPEFTNNTSWRFVDESFVFPSQANPFASYFPEEASFNNLSGVNLHNDFIAVKIGDLNGSATANNMVANTSVRNMEETILLAKNQSVNKNEVVEIPITFSELQSIAGYQLQLQYDTDVFSFLEITDIKLPNLTIENFGLNYLNDGVINANWINIDKHTIQANQPLFTIKLRANAPANLKDLITVDPFNAYNEIYKYDNSGVLYSSPLHLTFEDNLAIPITGNDQVFLYQNAPNPFEEQTTIQFNLPQVTKATVSIFDATGRLVWQTSKEYPAGDNQVTIESQDLGLEGVYIYTLDTDYGREVKKMILLSNF